MWRNPVTERGGRSQNVDCDHGNDDDEQSNDIEEEEMENIPLLPEHDEENSDGDENDTSTKRMMEWRQSERLKILLAVFVLTMAMIGLAALLSSNQHYQLFFNHDAWFPMLHGNNSNSTKIKYDVDCDCYESAAYCCDRTIFRTHKFGTILVGEMFHKNRVTNAKYRIHTMPTPKNLDYELPTTLDYRHILVTRNWMDAIVSGYLYHKAGYECWMDYRGNASATFHHHHSKNFEIEKQYRLKDWDEQLTYLPTTVPPRNNRSFCQYLQEESEEDGMIVLIDFALSRWYKGVVPYYQKVQEREGEIQKNNGRKSLFLCFEDLVDPMQQEQLFHIMVDFLFPGNNTGVWQLPKSLKASLEQQKTSPTGLYEGTHATNHDPKMRSRLRQLVEQYDRDLFGDTLATSSAVFGCGE